MAIKWCHNSTIGTVVGKDKDFAFYNRIGGCNRNRSLIRGGSIYFDFPSILCNGFDNRILGCIRNRVGDCFALSTVENGYIRCIECNCELWIISFGNSDNSTIYKGKIDIVIVLGNTLKEAVAVFAIRAIGTVLTVCTRCLSYVCPSFTIIHWKHPSAILYFQLRCNAVLAILAIRAIVAVFAVHAFCFYLIACIVGQPLAVKRPVIDSVRVFLYTDNRSISAIFAIFNCGGRTIWKVDNVTIRYLFNFGNRQIIL